MINEKEILRREEVDFRGVINRFKRGWPIVLLFLGIWLVIGVIFQLAFPPRYTATTQVMVEKPKSTSDPGTVVSTVAGFNKPDDYYYSNRRAVMTSHPIVSKALQKIGTISYYELGLFKKDLYKKSPIVVELDSTYMNFAPSSTPYNSTFEVSFSDVSSYRLNVEGKYFEDQGEFEVNGEFRFGEWIAFDNTRIRVRLSDFFNGLAPEDQNKCFGVEYGFILENPEALTLAYISSMDVEQEEVESSVFEVYLSGSAPKKQIDFLTALGDEFLSNHLREKTEVLELAINYLDQEIEKVSAELSNNEDSVQVFKTENAVTSINREGNLVLEKTAELQNQMVNYIVKDKYYTYLQEYLENNENYGNLISPQAFGVRDQLIAKLTEQLVELQQDRNYYEELSAQNNPAYRKIVSDIESIRNTILNSVKGIRSSNQIMIDNNNQRIRELEAEAMALPAVQRDLLRLERFARINENIYFALREKKSSAEIVLVSTIPNIRIIEPPHLTSVDPLIPQAPITFIAAIVLGLFFAFLYLIFKWIFNSTLDNASELDRFVPSANVIGELYHTNITKPQELEDYPESTLAAQSSAIIYRLKRNGPGSKLFAVSSHSPKEGKTFTASMLAMQASVMGYKTLLVDGNFKNPNIKKLFKVSKTPSMLDVINGNADRVEMIASSGKENLDIVDIGNARIVTTNEARAIRKLISELLPSYDCVFLDTAPFGSVSLSLSFLESADINLVAVRRNKTGYHALEEIQFLMASEAIKIDHFVVTDSFKPDVRFSLFGRRSNYRREKPRSVFGSLRAMFKRV